MQELISQLQIKISKELYVKDPTTSNLGRNIIEKALVLFNEVGNESFTFGKLAKSLGTTESSIYRYFENKQKLLMYLTSIYWGWLEYKLVFSAANISNPKKKLQTAIRSLCQPANLDIKIHGLTSKDLQKLAIVESSKVYLTREAKQKDEAGLFQGYERLCERLSLLISDLNKDYPYPHSMASMMIESIHHQEFFTKHIFSLSDINGKEGMLEDFISGLVFSTLKQESK